MMTPLKLMFSKSKICYNPWSEGLQFYFVDRGSHSV